MPAARRRFTAQQKADVVRRHLADKQLISALADEFQVQPSQVCLWIKQAGARLGRTGPAAKPCPGKGRDDGPARRIQALEDALSRKSELAAELVELLAHSLLARAPARQ